MAMKVVRTDNFGWDITNVEENVYIRSKGKGQAKQINFYFKGKLDGVQNSFSLTKRYGATKLSDAKKKARELVEEASKKATLGIGSNSITLKKAFEDYQSTRKVAEVTRVKDESFFRNHVFKVIKENRKVQTITTHDINALLKHLLKHNLSQSVMNDIRISLKEIFRQYLLLDLFQTATKWQSHEEPHESIIDILVDNKIDLHKFVNCMYKNFQELPIEYRIIMQLSFQCALRIGEARKITVSMLDLDNLEITATKDITKTKAKHTFPISEELANDIRLHIEQFNLANEDKLAIYKYYQPYKKKYKKALKSCTGLFDKQLKYISTHSNRKLFVTLMSMDGAYSDDFLDSLLSHKAKKSDIKGIYNEANLVPSHTRTVFNNYWQLLKD